jgi:hypothetical protein
VAEAARRVALADNIIIPNRRAREAHQRFDFMRTRVRGASYRGAPGCLLVGPTQSGKSTVLHTYQDRLNSPEQLESHRIPALMVTLTAHQTRKGLAQDILRAIEAFGYETLWWRGTEAVLLDRVQTYVRKLGVEILMLDEFHHLVDSDRGKVAASVAETIKWLLIEAVAPVVMSGIDAAWRPLRANPQLAARCEPAIQLNPLDPTKTEDRELFRDFLSDYLVEFEDLGLARNATAVLRQATVPDCIHESAGGVLGEACNLLKAALALAVLDGREEIDEEDLAAAQESRRGVFDPPGRNPFREGLSAVRRAQ